MRQKKEEGLEIYTDSGYAVLDKNAKHNRLVTRWNLWVPRGNNT